MFDGRPDATWSQPPCVYFFPFLSTLVVSTRLFRATTPVSPHSHIHLRCPCSKSPPPIQTQTAYSKHRACQNPDSPDADFVVAPATTLDNWPFSRWFGPRYANLSFAARIDRTRWAQWEFAASCEKPRCPCFPIVTNMRSPSHTVSLLRVVHHVCHYTPRSSTPYPSSLPHHSDLLRVPESPTPSLFQTARFLLHFVVGSRFNTQPNHGTRWIGVLECG